MKNIYVTHCSAKKNNSLKYSDKKVTPNELYNATPTKRFMKRCMNYNVKWAIFSDKYGVWFPYEKHGWYEKNPNTVSSTEFDNLVKIFEMKLKDYDNIYFYYNPGRFHSLYKKLLSKVNLKEKIIYITHLDEIKYYEES